LTFIIWERYSAKLQFSGNLIKIITSKRAFFTSESHYPLQYRDYCIGCIGWEFPSHHQSLSICKKHILSQKCFHQALLEGIAHRKSKALQLKMVYGNKKKLKN